MEISACMMVRDEEDHLGRCLDSIRSLVDEIFLVDTGSSDGTMEIAARYGARIYQHQWQNDFSLHRNQSLGYAAGDWSLVIDADEELVCDDPAGIKTWLSLLPADTNAVAFPVRDHQGGKVVLKFNSARLFRTGQAEYKGIVHNRAVYKGAAILCPYGHINHYGYDLAPEKKRRKRKRTRKLLRKRLHENPRDFQPYFYLAQMHLDDREYKDCINAAELYIRHRDRIDDFNTSIYYPLVQACIMAEDMEKADYWIGEAVKAIPGDLDIAFVTVEFGIKLQNPDIVAAGARRFVYAYDFFERDGAAQKERFVFNHTPEALSFCLYHFSLISLNDGAALMERLHSTLDQTNHLFKQAASNDLKRELEKLDLAGRLDKIVNPETGEKYAVQA